MVERVSFAHELELGQYERGLNARAFSLRTCQRVRSLNARSIPPPLGAFYAGGTEHVQELGARHLLIILAIVGIFTLIEFLRLLACALVTPAPLAPIG